MRGALSRPQRRHRRLGRRMPRRRWCCRPMLRPCWRGTRTGPCYWNTRTPHCGPARVAWPARWFRWPWGRAWRIRQTRWPVGARTASPENPPAKRSCRVLPASQPALPRPATWPPTQWVPHPLPCNMQRICRRCCVAPMWTGRHWRPAPSRWPKKVPRRRPANRVRQPMARTRIGAPYLPHTPKIRRRLAPRCWTHWAPFPGQPPIPAAPSGQPGARCLCRLDRP